MKPKLSAWPNTTRKEREERPFYCGLSMELEGNLLIINTGSREEYSLQFNNVLYSSIIYSFWLAAQPFSCNTVKCHFASLT